MRQVCTIVYYFCCLERGLFWLAPSPQNLNLWPEIMTACCYICIDVRGIVAKFCRTRLYSNKVTHLDLSVFFASLLGYQRQVERLNFLFCCFHFHVENKNKKQEVANCCELIVIKSQYLCAMLPKVCQVDYVHLEADLLVFVTLNIAKVGFQMNIINLTDFILNSCSFQR